MNKYNFPPHRIFNTADTGISTAGARKTNRSGRKKGKTRILTWTPEKQQIEEMLPERNKNKKTSVQKVTRKVLQEIKELENDTSDESSYEEYKPEEVCLVYGEFGKNEIWVRCIVCGQWANKACTNQKKIDYICDHCE
ncbi:hypothetical protein RN001_004155 [Aquatica leii]|uniref:Zinc finger PHD-type domain-containing protein n=1 Tax=Aquatica leii TaxID=1421715 RepID=A0AAN7Q733_9COLE|nr:hypothetical protein RN001_004155 [Aquatica leii]